MRLAGFAAYLQHVHAPICCFLVCHVIPAFVVVVFVAASAVVAACYAILYSGVGANVYVCLLMHACECWSRLHGIVWVRVCVCVCAAVSALVSISVSLSPPSFHVALLISITKLHSSSHLLPQLTHLTENIMQGGAKHGGNCAGTPPPPFAADSSSSSTDAHT